MPEDNFVKEYFLPQRERNNSKENYYRVSPEKILGLMLVFSSKEVVLELKRESI